MGSLVPYTAFTTPLSSIVLSLYLFTAACLSASYSAWRSSAVREKSGVALVSLLLLQLLLDGLPRGEDEVIDRERRPAAEQQHQQHGTADDAEDQPPAAGALRRLRGISSSTMSAAAGPAGSLLVFGGPDMAASPTGRGAALGTVGLDAWTGFPAAPATTNTSRHLLQRIFFPCNSSRTLKEA